MAANKTPIVDALQKYIFTGTVRFHMPGHKGKAGNSPLNRLLGGNVFAADVTNVPGMDDLHQTQGIIKESQKLAAQTFGADHSYFLINGSSCGLQALITAVCNPGDKILVPRNLHRSVMSGIILSGAIPVFFSPEYDPFYGIALGTLPETIEKALFNNPDIKAVLLVNPTYHGITSNISAIADITHKHKIPLIIDEAHGPHLGFHEELPESSLALGADGVVHGTHKILTAFTQASMLHIKGPLINRQRLGSVLRLLQSTSTSYLLLASLDSARMEIESKGREIVQQSLELSDYLRKSLNTHLEKYGIIVLDKEMLGQPGIFGLDRTKVTISVKRLSVTGLWAEQWLRDHYNIQVEMSDIFNLLLIIGPGNLQSDIDYFLKAMISMARFAANNPEVRFNYRDWDNPLLPQIPELVISPREAFFAQCYPLKLQEAVGKISAETIACYPPGIPVICPGERITEDIVSYLSAMREIGVHMQGCSDETLQTLMVVNSN